MRAFAGSYAFRERRRCGAVCGADGGTLANDWTSVLSTLAVCCWGDAKLSFSSFGMSRQRVKNASQSKVSQGDRGLLGNGQEPIDTCRVPLIRCHCNLTNNTTD